MSPPDLLPLSFAELSAALVPAFAGEPGNLVVLSTVGSTNALGRRLAEEYLKEGGRVPRTLLVALAQTAGRGRRGNAWQSPAGQGVYATLVLPLAGREGLERLPLAAAVGLCEALNRLLPGFPCRLKWPNDLVAGGEKIGGVLIEVVSGEEEKGAAVIGFGVNHGQAAGQMPKTDVEITGATSVRAHAPAAPPLGEVAAALSQGLIAAVTEPAPDLAQRYAELSAHRPGDAIAFRLGEERLAGTFRGFDERGFLRLEQAGSERLLSSGEVIEP